MKYICAIDPSNTKSAFVICEADSLKPIRFAKLQNELMFPEIINALFTLSYTMTGCEYAIEDIENFGGIVGRSVFDTCKWIGRIEERLDLSGIKYTEIKRSQERKTICPGIRNPKDTNIRHALIERFAPYESNMGKGTKKNPGWFYGFHADIWQAYAVAVTYHDLKKAGELKNE